MASTLAAASRALVARSAVLGALVADAASLGTHWLYGPDGVRTRMGDDVAFAPADAKNYTGPCYFAHGTRRLGQNTIYGEAIVVGLKALAAGSDVRAALRDALWSSYGFGGSFVGYVDTSTTESLVHLAELRVPRATALVPPPAGLSDDAVAAVASALLAALKKVSNREELPALLAAASGQLTLSDAAARDYLNAVVTAYVARSREPLGSTTDVQTNALARMIPFTAKASADGALSDEAFVAESAALIRETQNNDESVAYIVSMQLVLRRVIEGMSIRDAVDTVVSGADPALKFVANVRPILARLDEARAEVAKANTDSIAVTSLFGQPCNLRMTTPNIIHAVLCASSYRDAVMRCILGGGDNASRAAFAGAIVAAAETARSPGVNCVPGEWRVIYGAERDNDRVEPLLSQLFGA